MPYSSIEDLPRGVRHTLPEHAQSIYRHAFNQAWDRYAEHFDREAIAHRIAWAAVKRTYQKVGDAWVQIEVLSSRAGAMGMHP